MGKKLIIGIVVIIVVLLAAIFLFPLAYFGALDSENLIPERCQGSLEFSCEDYSLQNGDLTVFFQNRLGMTVQNFEVSSLALNGEEISNECEFNEEEYFAGDMIVLNCDAESEEGSLNNYDLEFSYEVLGRSGRETSSVFIAVRG